MQDERNLLDFTFEWEGLRACPLCESRVMLPNGGVEWLNMQFWYVVCPACGLKFMNPRPTRDSYRLFYRDYFWQQKELNLGFRKEGQMWGLASYEGDDSRDWSREEGVEKIKVKQERRFTTISEALLSKITLGADTDVLEVGCGFGMTLQALQGRYGCRVHAIEPSEEAKRVIERDGSAAMLGSYAEELEDVGAKGLRFDAIIFSHSLENTVGPFEIVQHARDALKDGGVIYVQCANLQTFDQMNPYHPFIFSESVFLLLAERLGLRYERLSPPTDRMLTSLFLK